jgi:hypothetical protein
MKEKVRFDPEFHLSNAYVAQVEKTVFASSAAIKDMMKQMEEMHAVSFCACISISWACPSR